MLGVCVANAGESCPSARCCCRPGRGLGLAVAAELASQGANVVICARDQAELDTATGRLRTAGATVLAVSCDVADPEQARQLMQQTVERFGAIDTLVNNAGIIQVGPLQNLTVANFHDAMQPIFWGTVHASLAVLEHMRPRRTGHIVNITTIGGKISVPHLMPYSSAKFAAVGFSEGLRAETAKDGVHVTTVVPGLMRTGSDVQAQFGGDTDREYAWFAATAAAPGLSMSADKAAQRIVQALREGRSEVVLGLPAKAAVMAHGLAPGATQRVLAVVNRMLPAGANGSLGATEPGLRPAARAGTTVTANLAEPPRRRRPQPADPLGVGVLRGPRVTGRHIRLAAQFASASAPPASPRVMGRDPPSLRS